MELTLLKKKIHLGRNLEVMVSRNFSRNHISKHINQSLMFAVIYPVGCGCLIASFAFFIGVMKIITASYFTVSSEISEIISLKFDSFWNYLKSITLSGIDCKSVSGIDCKSLSYPL
jgi:uncharacterized membrane protein